MLIQLTTFKDRDEGWKEFKAFVKVGTRTRAWEGFEGREINFAICIISFFKISMFAFLVFDLTSCYTKIRSRENICCCSFRYRCRWAMCLFNSLRLHYDFIVGDHNRLLFVCWFKPSSDPFVQFFHVQCWWKLNIVLMELQKSLQIHCEVIRMNVNASRW